MNAKLEGASVPSVESILKKKSKAKKPQVEEEAVKELTQDERISEMNKRANRQWEGQSSSLSINERVGRIRMAMKSHGFYDLWGHVDLPLSPDEKDKWL